VEAGGIEPPSEGASTTGSYVCIPRFDLTALAPTGGIARGQPAFVSAPAPPAMTGAQPEEMTLVPVLRARTGRAWLRSRQPERSCRLQLSSPAVFDEADRGPDTHRSLHHPRRSQVAPSGSGSTNASHYKGGPENPQPGAAS